MFSDSQFLADVTIGQKKTACHQKWIKCLWRYSNVSISYDDNDYTTGTSKIEKIWWHFNPIFILKYVWHHMTREGVDCYWYVIDHIEVWSIR